MGCGSGLGPIVKGELPKAAVKPASKLPPALEAAAAKRGVKVRASLYAAPSLEVLYEMNMEGVPGIMAKVSRSKAYSNINGEELADPGMGAVMCKYMTPWMFGFTDSMAVMGSARIMMAGLKEPACFVVNGSPAAHDDLAILEESLIACGFKKGKEGVWKL